MKYKYRFSIFTATYNRGHLLRQRYEELLTLDFKDFEWVVVSDGSTDNTSDEMKSFVAENKIPIVFIDKENGGKHTAWQAATPVFRGRYILTADDDDIIMPDTLSIFDKHWSVLEALPNYNEYWEVRTRCQRQDGTLVGKILPEPYVDSDYNSMNYIYKNNCEMVGCRKVEVLRTEAAVPNSFMFQDKVSNFSEGIRWSQAARKYKTRFVPDVTRVYLTSQDSLCSPNYGRKRDIRKTHNTLLGAIYELKNERDLMFKYNVKKYIKTIMVALYTSFPCKQNPLRLTDKVLDKVLLTLLFVPMSFAWLIRR